MKELNRGTVSDAVRVLRIGTRYRDLTPTQYQYSFDWLRQAGFVNDRGLRPLKGDGLSTMEAVLARYFEANEPAWLDEVDELIATPQDLPFDVVDLAEQVDISEQGLFRISQHVARKFDQARLGEIGHRGESLLVNWLRDRTDSVIDWVSEIDDTLGYDVRVSDAKRSVGTLNLEVKSTTASRRIRFFLSRNEFDTMQRSPTWGIQILRLNEAGISAVYFVENAWLRSIAPSDAGPHASWASVEVQLPLHLAKCGLHPELVRHMKMADREGIKKHDCDFSGLPQEFTGHKSVEGARGT